MATTEDPPEGADSGGEALKPKQEAAALSIASGSTIEEAAKAVSAGARTVKTWLTDPAFTARVSALRAELTSQALGKLTAAACRAADTLTELLEVDSPQVRLGAARAILDSMIRTREQVEIVTRLDALERRAAEQAERDR